MMEINKIIRCIRLYDLLVLVLFFSNNITEIAAFGVQGVASSNRASVNSNSGNAGKIKFQYQSSSSSSCSVKSSSTVDYPIADDIDVDDALQELNDLDDLAKGEDKNLSKKMISVSASVKLPFSAQLAFDAFSDLRRSPSWSSWLHSVVYIDIDPSEMKYSECGIPMRPTKWIMKIGKMQYSWDSEVNRLDPPYVIEWESTSGLKNMGVINFSETIVKAKGTSAGAYSGVLTDMTIKFNFNTPRLVARVLRKSKRISAFMEHKILLPTLLKFREVVMEKDLGMDLKSIQTVLSQLEEDI